MGEVPYPGSFFKGRADASRDQEPDTVISVGLALLLLALADFSREGDLERRPSLPVEHEIPAYLFREPADQHHPEGTVLAGRYVLGYPYPVV
ncbi:MAG TPA: hypothetical protein VLU98_02825, partial [Methanomicrobiales archaeon]|nr:hypothetical protein [Methanomicrobiales archaeon]